jgi:hypothetical protein
VTDILPSYIRGQLHRPTDDGRTLSDAATGEPVARISTDALDYPAILDYARRVGGPALRAMTFPERAAALKGLAKHLSARIPLFTELSLCTGSTRRDSAVDIDGGVGVLFVYASKGAKELGDQHILIDGDFESLGKTATFGVQHVVSPRLGAFVQINAFNFPVWGMLESFSPCAKCRQTRQPDRVSHRDGGARDHRLRSDSRRCSAACLRAAGRTAGVADRTGHDICNRFARDRHRIAPTSHRGGELRALHGRGGLAQQQRFSARMPSRAVGNLTSSCADWSPR